MRSRRRGPPPAGPPAGGLGCPDGNDWGELTADDPPGACWPVRAGLGMPGSQPGGPPRNPGIR